MEWHPFSVASGPDEPFVELFIRGLGDHTKKIVALSKQCAAENRLPWVLRDGPYGKLDFDYRRYGVVVLVGGGVGMNPIIGILKDIYTGYDNEARAVPQHQMESVHVHWVMRTVAEADVFIDGIRTHMSVAGQRHDLPSLKLTMHVTRESGGRFMPDNANEVMLAGRPNFTEVFDEITVVYGNFDVILDHFSRVSQLPPAPHAASAMLYLVPVLIVC